MKLDKWQEEILKAKGNLCARCGRQTGKSTVIAMKAAMFAVNNPDKQILVVSATERQAFLLYSKILNYLFDNFRSMIKKGKDRPTKSEIKLINHSIIRCLPTGLDGIGIRGYTTNMLIADEAHFIPEEVWDAVTPQLVTTEAIQILISTTHGREGYFARCFNNPSFTSFHVTTEEVALGREEPMKSRMLEHLASEKNEKTRLQFAQEYCAEFIDELRQLFPTDLIKKVMVLERQFLTLLPLEDNYLGVDIARMGEDESVLFSVQRIKRQRLTQLDMQITTKTHLNETIDLIKMHDKKHKYRKIYIDSAGVGAGVFDVLLQDSQTKRKVVSIENARKGIDRDDREKRLMKEDLYANLLVLMEQGKIELFNEPEILLSLRSVQYEYKEGRMKIFGTYTHIAEALVRAAWCMQDKTLNIYAYY